MMYKEVLQKKFEYGLYDLTEKNAIYRMDENTICKARIDDFEIVEKYHYDGDVCFRWYNDFLFIRECNYDDEEKVHLFSLPEFKEILLAYDLEESSFREYDDYIFVQNEKKYFRYDKILANITKMNILNGIVDFCIRKGNVFVCKNFRNLYIYEMNEDSIEMILQIAIDDVFPEKEVQKIYPDYTSSEMRLYKIMPYEDDIIVVTEAGIVRMTMCGKIVWKTIHMAYRTMQIIGHYGYETFSVIFYRINLDTGKLDLYGNNGCLPELKYNEYSLWFSGEGFAYHNGFIWRMLFANGFVFLAAIDPETGLFKYFHRFYDISDTICKPKFINGKLYLYDAITKTLHVLEEVEGEPEKTFCGVPMSETELELVDTTKKINNKKPAPTYEDSDIPLFEEIKQVAHIEHACVLDAECIDSLGDYSDVVTSLLSLADVRKFTIIEHSLSGSISLKKGRKAVEFTPDGSDYIDSDAMLKALNEFLPICGAKGKIFSLWTPDMLQTEMFFYTEDTEAVEKYSAENLQTDEAVDFEDMKGEIKW